MDPLGRLHANHASDGSPSPFAPTLPSQAEIKTRHPRTSQTVLVGYEEGDSMSRIHAVAECVETKTVTTTTTTRRLYPSIDVPQPPLASLNSKEYPLAHKEIPAELRNFSFETDGSHGELQDRSVGWVAL